MKFYHLLVLSLSIVVLSVPFASACENEYDGPPPPTLHAPSEIFPGAAYVGYLRGNHQGDSFSPEQKLAAFEESGDFRDESNYAVALMRTGKHQEARDIFVRLVEEHPDEYIVAANLGTAYELTGDNEQALAWIRKGMELNPQSHAGTEWLHVKVLQAKIAAEKDPDWFAKNSVLSLSFGTASKPETPGELERDDSGRPLTLEMIRHALEYQLHERLFYVKPKDLVVASLLETLANILLLEATSDAHKEKAYRVYLLASEYGLESTKTLQLRINSTNPFHQPTTPRRSLVSALMFAGAAIMVVGTLALVGGVLAAKRRR